MPDPPGVQAVAHLVHQRRRRDGEHGAVGVRQAVAGHRAADQAPEVATTARLEKEIVTRFQAMTPFLEFLNAPLPKERKRIDPRELLI